MNRMRTPPPRPTETRPSPSGPGRSPVEGGLVLRDESGDVVVVLEDEGVTFDTVSRDGDDLVVSSSSGSVERTVPFPDDMDLDPSDVVAVVLVDEGGNKRQNALTPPVGPTP